MEPLHTNATVRSLESGDAISISGFLSYLRQEKLQVYVYLSITASYTTPDLALAHLSPPIPCWISDFALVSEGILVGLGGKHNEMSGT